MQVKDDHADVDGSGRVLVARPNDGVASQIALAFQKKGHDCVAAHRFNDAMKLIETGSIVDAVVEIEMEGRLCFPIIRRLHELNSAARVVVVTSQPSIATAVQAIKLGAIDYLPTPIEPDDVIMALYGNGARRRRDFVQPPLSVDRIEWEHINRVLTLQRGNISEAARQLGMHRRTLQRKLKKTPALQ